MDKRVIIAIHFLILLTLIYCVVLIKLGSFHLRWWDESMFAVNTYEMLQNGKWFSFYFDGVPDLYNTKPPLTSWLQILFIKIIGYNETALRLPSAIAACLTITTLFRFASKHFNYLWAWISALILMTSYGFIHFHTARTGDSDALLTLFVLLANLYFLRFVLNQHKKDILFFFLFITLAFSIKLYAALLFIPAYVAVLSYKKLWKQFVMCWPFLIGVLFFVLSIGSLLYLRELDTPGYIHQVIFKDAGRMTTVVENHQEPTLFYLDKLVNTRFALWFVFFVVGAVFAFFHPEKKSKTILTIFLLFVVSYLSIIMVSITKLEWYDMPLYPYLALLAAYPIYLGFQQLKTKEKSVSTPLKYALLALVFMFPYNVMFRKSQASHVPLGERKLEANERFMFHQIRNKQSLDGIKVLHNSWKGSLLFYQYKLSEHQQKISLISDVSQVAINDHILVCDETLQAKLANSFETNVVNQLDNAKLYLIKNKKMVQ